VALVPHSRQAELVVIFGEDLAALLGLVFALLAVVLTMVTGNPIYDAIGTHASACCWWWWRCASRGRSRRC
jgi:hypothetical protein